MEEQGSSWGGGGGGASGRYEVGSFLDDVDDIIQPVVWEPRGTAVGSRPHVVRTLRESPYHGDAPPGDAADGFGEVGGGCEVETEGGGGNGALV